MVWVKRTLSPLGWKLWHVSKRLGQNFHGFQGSECALASPGECSTPSIWWPHPQDRVRRDTVGEVWCNLQTETGQTNCQASEKSKELAHDGYWAISVLWCPEGGVPQTPALQEDTGPIVPTDSERGTSIQVGYMLKIPVNQRVWRILSVAKHTQQLLVWGSTLDQDMSHVFCHNNQLYSTRISRVWH